MHPFLLKENYTSKNLYNKVIKLTENQVQKISNGLDWVVKYHPSAVLVGGTALVHYLSGGRDLTPDIDFIVGDMSKLKSLLDDQDILYRPLRDDNNNAIGITVNKFNTDFLDASMNSRELNKLILQSSNIAKIGGYNVKIVSPELLAIMKLELGRDKDIKDGFNLITSGLLNKNEYVNLTTHLKKYLQDYASIANYADMI